MTKKYFGTDGIRGKVGTSTITPEFALKLGYAAGRAFRETWSKRKRPKVLIGKDTRVSGYLLESALESGFAAAGVDVALLGPMPTPAIAYLTRTFHACAGVVVSASHNPYYDNGIKFFSSRGRKLDDDLENKIEKYLDESMGLVSPEEIGKATRVTDARGRYIEHCKSTIPMQLELNGVHIVLDCANGANYQVGPSVFKELGAKVTTINNEPDGFNINKNCGSTHLEHLKSEVVKQKADLGIAFDGDGDRVSFVTEKGQEIDGDALIYLITLSRIQKNKKPEGVVGTLMTNMGTEAAIRNLGVDFERADVGDRYVMQKLQEKNWFLGGESSGHIICLNKSTTGDGIVAALQVLEFIINNKDKSLSSMLSNYKLYPLKLENIEVTDKRYIMTNSELLENVDKANKDLKGEGRVLIRASGTEEMVRVMVEAKDSSNVDKYISKFTTQIRGLDK